MYKQGDIIVVKFPFTDGSEFKKRPSLIISNSLVNQTGDYLIIQITSKQNFDKLSLEIKESDCLISLPLKSYIRIHKIFTINESLILNKISTIKPSFLKIIQDKINEIIKIKEAKKKGSR